MNQNNTYIINDPVILEQQFACISFLNPENIIDPVTEIATNKYVGKFRTLKIRGCFPTFEKASEHAHYLRDNIEPHISVCVAEVGKWIPFDDDEKFTDDI
jgi:hypothetical protein